MACLLRCPKDSLSRAGRTDKRPGHHFESSAAKEARFVDFGQRRLRRLRGTLGTKMTSHRRQLKTSIRSVLR